MKRERQSDEYGKKSKKMKVDGMLSLNDDCIGVIMKYLGPRESDRISKVHPILSSVSDKDFLWRNMFPKVGAVDGYHIDGRDRALAIMELRCDSCQKRLKYENGAHRCKFEDCQGHLLCETCVCNNVCMICERQALSAHEEFLTCDYCHGSYHECCSEGMVCYDCSSNSCSSCLEIKLCPICYSTLCPECFGENISCVCDNCFEQVF
jgi:hypothetical protein